MSQPGKWMMRCAGNCGRIVRGESLAEVQKRCVERAGFVRSGKLYFCPNCARKHVGKPVPA